MLKKLKTYHALISNHNLNHENQIISFNDSKLRRRALYWKIGFESNNFWGVAIHSKDTEILKLNQYQKFDKVIIYADF